VVSTTQEARRPVFGKRAWGKIGFALFLAGVVSFIVFILAFQTSVDAYEKHPCPMPPAPWQVWATWWPTFVIFSAALVCLIIAALVNWRRNTGAALACVVAAALTILPLAYLIHLYGKPVDIGVEGPVPCTSYGTVSKLY
jgi:heme/copper-type cytochrome/quinol oxidase subunit 3